VGYYQYLHIKNFRALFVTTGQAACNQTTAVSS